MILIRLCSLLVLECWCLDTEHKIVLRLETAMYSKCPSTVYCPCSRVQVQWYVHIRAQHELYSAPCTVQL